MAGNKKRGGRNMEVQKKAAGSDGEGGVTNTELPMANLIRLMKKVLPGKAKIGGAAKGLTHDCAVEFVGFVGDEASEKAKAEHRRTIAPEDYLGSFGDLGFDRYIEPMEAYIHGYREFERAGGNRRVVPTAATTPLTPSGPTFTDAELQFLRSVIPSISDDEYNGSSSAKDGYGYGYGYGKNM
uniref:Transcription factor CBF/NF-Y/archaeal histone domain-containing protein n=1 Tax=Oryza punctata TaxID=4537 RepID=A0A0E0K4P7_ORYPU